MIGHIYSNYKAVKSVIMNTFNQNRFHLLVNHYFNTSIILNPKTVNQMEPVFATVKRAFHINLGCSFSNLSNLNSSQLIRFTNDEYYLQFDMKSELYF